jgi:hypothetical protein
MTDLEYHRQIFGDDAPLHLSPEQRQHQRELFAYLTPEKLLDEAMYWFESSHTRRVLAKALFKKLRHENP